MAVLTVDLGGTPLTLACQRGGHAPPRRVGNVHTGQGPEESSVRTELMVVPIVTAPIPSATYATLKAMFALGAQKTCEGDIFNNNGNQIVCSGKITSELRETADSWIVNLTLFEVNNAATGVYSPDTTDVALTPDPSDEDPGDGSVETMTIGGSGAAICFRALDAATPATCSLPGPCAITYSAVPERIWLTPPLAAGTVSGTPIVVVHSKGINGGSGIELQSTLAKLYHVRAGVDIAGPVTSGYQSGSWSGGNISLPFSGAISWTLLSGDRIRLELWSRLSLQPGATDPQPYVLARQTICYGGFWGAYLRLGGIVSEL